MHRRIIESIAGNNLGFIITVAVTETGSVIIHPWGDIYPVESAQTIIDALKDFGIEEHSCDETPEANPSVEITLGEVTTTTIEVREPVFIKTLF